MSCVVQEDSSSWNPNVGCYGKILDIKSFKPNREKHEIGQVSAVLKDHVIIDESVLVERSTRDEKFILGDNYEYEAIESTSSVDGRSYYWRLTKMIRKVDKTEAADRKALSYKDVEMNDVEFNLRLDSRELSYSVGVFNNSSESVTLKTCEITHCSGLIRVDRTELNVEIRQGSGKFNVYLKISPKQVGSFVEELTADFGNFQKKCSVTLQVEDKQTMNDGRRSRSDLPADRESLFPVVESAKVHALLTNALATT